MKLITGIDEAGRGAMIGSMYIGAVTIEKKDEKKLKALGVKDSKLLTPKKRSELELEIKKIAKWTMALPIHPCLIDNYRAKKVNLDRIEAMKMAEVIEVGGCEHVYLDALTANPVRFGQQVRKLLKNKKIKLVSENYADKNYVVVAAASIIAKVQRDRDIDELKRRVDFDFASGYPHDPKTIEFVDMLIKKNKKLPAYVRKSWITTQLLQEKNWQRRIKDFILAKGKIKKEDCIEGI